MLEEIASRANRIDQVQAQRVGGHFDRVGRDLVVARNIGVSRELLDLSANRLWEVLPVQCG